VQNAVRPALAQSCSVTVVSDTGEWNGDANDPTKVKAGMHTCMGDITWEDGVERADHVVRTVTENGRTHNFTSQGFEEE
jgi:hypothetical protein